ETASDTVIRKRSRYLLMNFISSAKICRAANAAQRYKYFKLGKIQPVEARDRETSRLAGSATASVILLGLSCTNKRLNSCQKFNGRNTILDAISSARNGYHIARL